MAAATGGWNHAKIDFLRDATQLSKTAIGRLKRDHWRTCPEIWFRIPKTKLWLSWVAQDISASGEEGRMGYSNRAARTIARRQTVRGTQQLLMCLPKRPAYDSSFDPAGIKRLRRLTRIMRITVITNSPVKYGWLKLNQGISIYKRYVEVNEEQRYWIESLIQKAQQYTKLITGWLV